MRRLLRRLFKATLLLTLVAAAGLAGYGAYLVHALGLDRAEIERRAQNARVEAVPAETVRAPQDARKIVAPLYIRPAVIPDHVRQAFVTAEDRRFYSWWHVGLDPRAIGRAALSLARWKLSGDRSQLSGGSTIAMQLAKMLFLNGEISLKRKLDQMVLAVWLRMLFDRDDILAMYLNNAYFGDGRDGIEAAARHCFGRSVMKAPRIDLFEAAMLARSVRAPSEINCNRRPTRLKQQAEWLVAEMARQGHVTADEASAAVKAAEARQRGPKVFRIAPSYFRDLALRDLMPEPLRRTDERLVLGLTLEPEAQLYSERFAAEALAEARGRGYDQIAVVLLRHDGAVAAHVGGADYGALDGFDIAVNGSRSPGSTLKPFLYLCALENGRSGATPVLDTPRQFAADWTPKNHDGRYLGRLSLEEAMVRSRNPPAVAELQSCGFDRFSAVLRRVGITAAMPEKLTIALGSAPVPLMQLTAGYASVANGGQRVAPYAVWYARRLDGSLVYRRPSASSGPPAMDRRTNCAMAHMLRRVVTAGTGRNAAFAHPVAGKTGTSSGYRDALFIGFSAEYVMGVWIGATDGRRVTAPMTGGGLPAKLFRRTMATLHDGGEPAREIGCATREALAETGGDSG